MRSGTPVLPMVGLLAALAGWPLRPQRQPDQPHPTVAHREADAGHVVMIDGRVAHRVAPTVAELP